MRKINSMTLILDQNKYVRYCILSFIHTCDCAVPPTTHYSLQYMYFLWNFPYFQRKMNKMCITSLIQLVLVNLVESSVFFLAGTLTSLSLTVTQFTLLAVDSLLEALLDAELLLKDTSMFLVSTCTFRTFNVIFCNLFSL